MTTAFRPDDGQTIALKIDRAFTQLESGEFLSAEDSRADMEKRKAEWHANQRVNVKVL